MTFAEASRSLGPFLSPKELKRKANPKRGLKTTDVDVEVGARVRTLRIMKNMTLEDVASDVGLSYQQIFKIEHAINRMTCGNLLKIAASLEVHPCKILMGEDDEYFLEIKDKWAVEMLSLFSRLPDGKRDLVLSLIEQLSGSDKAA